MQVNFVIIHTWKCAERIIRLDKIEMVTVFASMLYSYNTEKPIYASFKVKKNVYSLLLYLAVSFL